MKLERSFQEVNPYPSPRSSALLVLIALCALMALTPAYSQAAVNDHFADAIGLTGVAGNTSGTNVDATSETGEPAHLGFAGGKSVWWKWTAPANQLVHFNTFNSTFDTVLLVYTGDSVDALTLVAWNDDYTRGTSAVYFEAQAGVEYKIVVDGYDGSSGTINLNWTTQFATVSGTVFQADGKTPVTDANLMVDVISGDPCGYYTVVGYQSLDSGNNGAYEISNLPPGGNYYVRVRVLDGNYIEEWWADSASVHTCDAATVFSLGSGETKTGVNFQLDPGGVVKGTLFKTDGVTPVTDASFDVGVFSGDPCGDYDWVQDISPRDDGTYEIGGIPTGSNYFLRVTGNGGNYIDEWWATPASVRTCGSAGKFSLDEGTTKTGMNFQLDPGGVIKGTVFKTDGTSPVTDGDLVIDLFFGDPCGVSEEVASTSVESSGTYEMVAIPGGTGYFLRTRVYGANYTTEWWASPASVNTCGAAKIFPVNDGETKTGVNFQLDPGAVITGTVYEDDGSTPLYSKIVLLSLTTENQCVEWYDRDFLKSAWTDSDGTFRLEGVTPGNTYYLTAFDPMMENYAEEWWASSQSTTACYQAEAITIPAVQEYPGFNFQLDVYEPDWDGDGIATVIEDRTDVCTDSRDADTDDDGIADGDEDANHNGLVDTGETDPCEADTDGDGIQDGTELGITSSVADPEGDGPSKGTDVAVFVADADPSTTTDPRNADTDGDGLKDGEEDANFNGKVDDGETDPAQKDGKDSSPIYFPVQTPDGKKSIIFIE